MFLMSIKEATGIMQNNIKKVLVIFSMILVLCFSSIGITAKADEKVYNQDNVSTTNNQNVISTKADNIDTNKNKTNSTENKNTGSTTIPNPSDTNVKNNQDSSIAGNQETSLMESLPAWKKIDGKLHYVTKEGIVEKTGWFKEKEENSKANNDNEYYLDGNHAATIGWKEIDKSWYYFNENGIKQTGWKVINYNSYHLNKDGIMETGWIQ